MTTGPQNRNNEGRNRADVNQARKLQAVRRLQRLLEDASDPEFTGTVGVEISAKDGRFATPKVVRIEYPND